MDEELEGVYERKWDWKSRESVRAYNRDWYLKNRERRRQRRKELYWENHELMLRKRREWYRKDRERGQQLSRKWYWENRDRDLARQKAKRDELRLEILSHYSEGLRCVRCGFEDLRALTIDHINEDGNERRKIEGKGSMMHTWLKNHNYPEGYQVLCMNCQYIKHREYVEEQMTDRLHL